LAKWAYIVVGFAALAGAAGVTEAAFAAHKIADPLFKVSADILVVNAAAVIAISAFALARSRCCAFAGAALLLIGTLLFCGELSSHVLLGRKVLAMAAPIGGIFMIGGWLVAAVDAFAAAVRSSKAT
jgi:uncharacterized membrane protein YgdD (TMEM256/DUF423 family)